MCTFFFSFASNLLHLGSSQVEEKKVSEKTLQTPLLPSPVAEHVKCNILKAQLESASRVSAQVCGAHAFLWFQKAEVPPGPRGE